LRWYLPALFGPNPSKNDLKIWRIIVEAYLSGGELRSNGSTFVPDFHTLGRIKDCMGVGHDFLFELHQLGWEDAYGHTWSLLEANRMYFDFCVIAGHPDRGAIRWFGLLIASWIPWWFGREDGGTSNKCVEHYRLPLLASLISSWVLLRGSQRLTLDVGAIHRSSTGSHAESLNRLAHSVGSIPLSRTRRTQAAGHCSSP
jgi:hypothetical protein